MDCLLQQRGERSRLLLCRMTSWKKVTTFLSLAPSVTNALSSRYVASQPLRFLHFRKVRGFTSAASSTLMIHTASSSTGSVTLYASVKHIR